MCWVWAAASLCLAVTAGAGDLLLSDFETPGQWSGLEVSPEPVKEGRSSGKWWHMDQTPTVRLAACPRDWSAFAGIGLWVCNPARQRGSLVLTVTSEDPKTPGPDAYAYRVDLNGWEGWLDLTIPLTGMDLVGAPRGWHQVDGLYLTAKAWMAEPNPDAVVYLDQLRLLGRESIRGPRLSDQEFFSAMDLSLPGLTSVAAAVQAGDYQRAKGELLAYYRSREKPRWSVDWRRGPRDEKPPLSALTSWNGFAHSLTVDWTGWKCFRLRKADFKAVHEPIGWDFIRYVALAVDDPKQTSRGLWVDDLRLLSDAGSVNLGDFEEGSGGWEGLEPSTAQAHSGRRSGKWADSAATRVVRNANLVHDWTGYDALEFWVHSPAATGARVTVVLDSEDLEYPETVQDVLDHRWLRVHGKLFDMGRDLDWSLLPFAGDDPDRTREWTWCGLNRMHQWIVLMRAYWVTADERYPREVVNQLLDWTGDCPVPLLNSGDQSQTWRTIEGGIRMAYSWPDTFHRLLASPSFTPDACCTMVKSMVEHARHLEKWREASYWARRPGSGLANVAVLFPEFRESEEWWRTAVESLHDLLDEQVYPDGAEYVLSTGYQYVALATFLELYQLAKLNNMPLPPDYGERLTSMYHCDVYLAEPDWRLPDLNDGSRRSVLENLMVGQREVAPEDPVLSWAASGGQRGTPPAVTSYLFPYAGWMVMRSGWKGPDERYGLLEAGPYGFGHQHEDKLNLVLYGYGREQISDAGYYDYDASQWRRYVLSTRGHNTIRVDGQDQHREGLRETYVTREPLKDIEWATSDALDYGAGVYAEGYGPERTTAVVHRRQMVFVKPSYFVVVDTLEGQGTHEIESLFHLNHDEAEVEGSVARSIDPGVSNVLVAAAPVDGLQVQIVKGQTEPGVQGFIPNDRWHASWKTPEARVPDHGKREVPTVVFSLRAALPARLAYVLMPYPKGQSPPVSCRLLRVEGPGVAIEVLLPGGRKQVVLIGTPGRQVRCGEMTTERQVAVFDATDQRPRPLKEL